MKRCLEELWNDFDKTHASKARRMRLKEHELLEIRETNEFFDYNLEKAYLHARDRSKKCQRRRKFHHSLDDK